VKLTKKDIEDVAQLARIGITEAEKAEYQKELSAILDYVEQLNEVDTEGVEPIYNIAGAEHVVRADNVKEFEGASVLLEQAPATHEGQLKVKEIFGEK